MPNPKNFSTENAINEVYAASGNDTVTVYRFADQNKPCDWESRYRQKIGGSFIGHYNSLELNDWALKQSSYGNKSENSQDNPFISVATSYEELYKNGELWVQNIIQKAPSLGVFEVPFDKLFRPSPTKSLSKSETEWLYYDGDNVIRDFFTEWMSNPYKQ